MSHESGDELGDGVEEEGAEEPVDEFSFERSQIGFGGKVSGLEFVGNFDGIDQGGALLPVSCRDGRRLL